MHTVAAIVDMGVVGEKRDKEADKVKGKTDRMKLSGSFDQESGSK